MTSRRKEITWPNSLERQRSRPPVRLEGFVLAGRSRPHVSELQILTQKRPRGSFVSQTFFSCRTLWQHQDVCRLSPTFWLILPSVGTRRQRRCTGPGSCSWILVSQGRKQDTHEARGFPSCTGQGRKLTQASRSGTRREKLSKEGCQKCK